MVRYHASFNQHRLLETYSDLEPPGAYINYVHMHPTSAVLHQDENLVHSVWGDRDAGVKEMDDILVTTEVSLQMKYG